jgi:drug/metabolite transporter (DMT)-like permease
VIGVFSSALLLGEALSLSKLIALGLVVVALALTSLGKRS